MRVTQHDMHQFMGTDPDDIAVSGTEDSPILITDGIKYLCEAGFDEFISGIAKAQTLPVLKAEQFQVWKLDLAGVEIVPCQCPKSICMYTFTVEDGNNNALGAVLAAWHGEPLDIEPDENGMLVLWFENETLMLPSER